MLTVSALQVGHPVEPLVLMKADNLPFQKASSENMLHKSLVESEFHGAGFCSEFERELQGHALEDGSQASGPTASTAGLFGNRLDGIVAECKIYAIISEQDLVLLQQALWASEEDPQISLGERIEFDDEAKAVGKFRQKPAADQLIAPARVCTKIE